jgi:hypothetical protein
MTARVFIVQRPAQYDKTKGGWVNKYDLSPAAEHGELVFLLRPGNIFKAKLADALERLERELADFSDADHLLAVGDPVAIAAAVMVAGKNNTGRVSLLKFDRMSGKYDPYRIVLTPANNG